MSNTLKNTKNIYQIFIVVTWMCCVNINSALPGVSDDLTVVGTLIAGKPLSHPSPRSKRDTELTCDIKKPKQQCASDCKTLLFCDLATLIGKFSCPSAKPDCDTDLNTCVTKRPAIQCPLSQQTDSSCAGNDGYFPDPINCRTYNYCEDGKVIQKYTCPVYYSFDVQSEQCKRGAPCGIINCYGKSVALHSTYPHLYAFCYNNAIIPGSYSTCPQTTQEFDIDEFDCKTKCKTEGYIPHKTECNMYYRCLATGPWGTLERTLQTCPPKQNFNKLKKTCDKTTKFVQKYTCPVNYAADIEAQHCMRGGRCGTFNCVRKIAAIHPTYPHIYAFCKNNVMIPGSYSACPKTTQEYDLKDLDCKIKCRIEGYIPHRTECNLFYRGLASGPGGALEMTLQSCPRNQNYNQLKQKCEKNIECQ